MTGDPRPPRIGVASDVAWITEGTSVGLTITSAIPPVFDAYATIVLPDDPQDREQQDQTLLAVLGRLTAQQPWWLGYLDTGADDVVMPEAPMVRMYQGWNYVLLEAGPEQAATLRKKDASRYWGSSLPNLMFPADRSWLLSTLWDDDWTCVGGSADLVNELLSEIPLHAKQVALEQDATPPGHQAL